MRKNVTQIIALAIRDALARVVTNVPGFGGTQVFEAFCEIASGPHWPSFHEEVAYSIAHGASLVGQRSATLIKSHGLAKAANSVVDSLSAGVRAGFVVLVFDDKLGKHSDSVLDTEALLQGLRIPYVRPQAPGLYREIVHAFARSEALQLPVALLIDTDYLGQSETCTFVRVEPRLPGYERNVVQQVLCPLLAGYQHQILTAKLNGEAWQTLKAPSLPRIPDSLPAEWQATARLYGPFFEVFRGLRGKVVVGDTGIATLFAFPPYHCVDICTYMGGSIPLAVGAYLAGYRDTWAVTGDFSFIAAGHLGLVEAVQREIPLKIVVFYNAKAQTTGGQPIPAHALENILKGYESNLTEIKDPLDSEAVEAVLKDVSRADEMRIVVADYRARR